MATTTDNVNIKINVETTNADKNTENLKKRMKELKEAMAQLKAAGKDTSEEYQRMAQEAGRLRDAMGDVDQEINNLANDNQTLAATMQGVGAGVAVFGGLQAATALLGVEDKNLLKIMQKVQATQALLNSVNTIAQALNKSSALMTALRAKSEKALNKELVQTTQAETAGTAATASFTAAEGAATTGAITLKGAVKAVGTAIKSIPVVGWILAAIAGITALIALIVEANDEEERGIALAKERLKLYNKIKEAEYSRYLTAKDEETHWNDVLDKLHSAKEGSAEYEDILSNIASYTGVSAQYLGSHPKLIDQITKAQMKANSAQEAYKNNIADINNGAMELDKLMHERGEIEFIPERDRSDEDKERLAVLKESITAGQEQQKVWISQTEDLKKQADAAEKVVYQYRNIAKANEEVTKSNAEANKARKERDLANRRELAERSKLQNEARLAELKMNVDATVEGTQARLEAERAYLREQERQDKEALRQRLANAALTEKERLALASELNAKWRNKETELDAKFQEKLVEDRRKAEDGGLKVRENAVRTEMAMLTEETQEWYDKKIDLDRLQEEREKTELQRQLEDRLISQEAFQSEYDLIVADHAKTRMELEMECNKRVADDYRDKMQQRLGYAETFANAFSSVVNSAMDAELEAVAGNEEQEKAIRKKYAKAQFLSEIAGIGVNTASAIMGAWNSVAEIVFPGNVIAGGILTAMLATTGMMQTAQAMSSMQKALSYGRGGYIRGKSHNEGGVDINVEGGEAIINKKAVGAYAPLLSAINQSTGGVPINVAGTSQSKTLITTTVDDGTLQKIVEKTVAGIVSIPVTVTQRDITDAQTERRTIVTRGLI